ELGINYIDTATNYTTSETRVGKAIAGRSEGLIIATKTMARTADVMEAHLKQSLEHIGVGSIDLYQFHNVSDPDAVKAILAPGGPLAAAEKAKKAGLVKHIGVTSHSLDMAKELVRSDRFETIMFPFNFVAREPEDELLSLCKEHDVGFIAMKPMGGGLLDNPVIAFKYLMRFPDIVPIVGIERVREIEEIVPIVEGPAEMTAAELAEMERIKRELGTRFCRRCDYCQPCTEGIPISTVMMLGSFARRLPPERIFTGGMAEAMDKAAQCSKCGDCETRCPYNLSIRDMIEENVTWYQAEKEKRQGRAA
ncbi:MAG: aldo/keto reductase, partial [Chloroflexota bacterium]